MAASDNGDYVGLRGRVVDLDLYRAFRMVRVARPLIDRMRGRHTVKADGRASARRGAATTSVPQRKIPDA